MTRWWKGVLAMPLLLLSWHGPVRAADINWHYTMEATEGIATNPPVFTFETCGIDTVTPTTPGPPYAVRKCTNITENSYAGFGLHFMWPEHDPTQVIVSYDVQARNTSDVAVTGTVCTLVEVFCTDTTAGTTPASVESETTFAAAGNWTKTSETLTVTATGRQYCFLMLGHDVSDAFCDPDDSNVRAWYRNITLQFNY